MSDPETAFSCSLTSVPVSNLTNYFKPHAPESTPVFSSPHYSFHGWSSRGPLPLFVMQVHMWRWVGSTPSRSSPEPHLVSQARLVWLFKCCQLTLAASIHGRVIFIGSFQFCFLCLDCQGGNRMRQTCKVRSAHCSSRAECRQSCPDVFSRSFSSLFDWWQQLEHTSSVPGLPVRADV